MLHAHEIFVPDNPPSTVFNMNGLRRTFFNAGAAFNAVLLDNAVIADEHLGPIDKPQPCCRLPYGEPAGENRLFSDQSDDRFFLPPTTCLPDFGILA